jgi:dTDP-4-amino-4,6-dideoxygalactose transaminase
MKVPFLDLAAINNELLLGIAGACKRVLERGQYILGPEVEAFEREFAEYIGTKYCVGVGNGFDALRLALQGSIAPGREVIVPANTCAPTVKAVQAAGMKPVFVDPDLETRTIGALGVKNALAARKKVAAVVSVHLYGMPCGFDVDDLAESEGLWHFEDCAQAHGAMSSLKKCGSIGDAGCWSFYPSKNLGALGDAGAITTNDGEFAALLRELRSYGELEGSSNSRLDELQAAILREKLKHLPAHNARRQANAEQYFSGLRDLDGISLPAVPAWATPCWHQFVIRCNARDKIRASLAERGIETMIHYPKAASSGFPVSEQLSREVLSLPVGPHLRPTQIYEVIQAMRAVAS